MKVFQVRQTIYKARPLKWGITSESKKLKGMRNSQYEAKICQKELILCQHKMSCLLFDQSILKFSTLDLQLF